MEKGFDLFGLCHWESLHKEICMSVVKKILRSLPFEINLQPGRTLPDFIEAQGERMRRCAKAVRKMCDLEETQPWDDGEKARFNGCCFFLGLFDFSFMEEW